MRMRGAGIVFFSSFTFYYCEFVCSFVEISENDKCSWKMWAKIYIFRWTWSLCCVYIQKDVIVEMDLPLLQNHHTYLRWISILQIWWRIILIFSEWWTGYINQMCSKFDVCEFINFMKWKPNVELVNEHLICFWPSRNIQSNISIRLRLL